MKKNLLLCLLVAIGLSLSAQLTSQQVLEKNDALRYGESSYSEMSMTIVRPTWTRTIGMKAWSLEQEYSMVIITSPAKEKGQGFLKRKNELWNWMPTINRVIKMSASVMGQSWMGSDFTNADMVQTSSILVDYTNRLLEDVAVDNVMCYQIELIPLPQSAVVWGKAVVFIDKKDFILRKALYYDEEMKLAQTMLASNIQQIGGRKLATHMEMLPAAKPGNKTMIDIQKSDLNINLTESFFSQQNLKK